MNPNLKVLKAKLMLWTDVSYHDMEEIEKLQLVPDLERILCSILEVDQSEPKKGVLLELYVQTVLFCQEHNFKKEQTSSLLSIVKSIHEANVETPLDNIEECVKYCQELLLCHSVRRPPFSIDLFNTQEATCILKYIHNGYLRHYKFYKYIFAPMVKLDLSLTYTETVQQEPQTPNDSSLTDACDSVEKEESLETQEDSATQQEDAAHSSELKALIEQEVKEQMSLVSDQLDQRMKEIALRHSSASSTSSSQPNQKTKK